MVYNKIVRTATKSRRSLLAALLLRPRSGKRGSLVRENLLSPRTLAGSWQRHVSISILGLFSERQRSVHRPARACPTLAAPARGSNLEGLCLPCHRIRGRESNLLRPLSWLFHIVVGPMRRGSGLGANGLRLPGLSSYVAGPLPLPAAHPLVHIPSKPPA